MCCTDRGRRGRDIELGALPFGAQGIGNASKACLAAFEGRIDRQPVFPCGSRFVKRLLPVALFFEYFLCRFRGVASTGLTRHDALAQRLVIGRTSDEDQRHAARLGELAQQFAFAAFQEGGVDDGRPTCIEQRAGQSRQFCVGITRRLRVVDSTSRIRCAACQ